MAELVAEAVSAACASTTAARTCSSRRCRARPPPPRAAVLLSPFDNLLWDRPFARRILGFDHLIEVYKPAPQRQYGYYVLPLLRGDRIVGRADLKSERKESRLIVRAFHREDGVRASGALDDALDTALDRLARSIGLTRCAGEGQRRGGAAHRGAIAAPGRLHEERPRDGAAPRLPPDRRRPAGRAAAAPRPLQPSGRGYDVRSSTGCSGRSARSSSGTRSSTRSRICRSCARGFATSGVRATPRTSGGCTSS